ncbi:LysR substrate-binding domain-containing protein [Burkholderia pseudomultivorans]|uniref:Hca operon transcriptional activator HcaR n=1 Tax=Burkholderia pseudomultivorans TaxID=1207504 RepID=A0ABU2E4I7_9BURK|nr:LysR substrate-binding domain-containing protein [Burkholderia pseudomultivorans]MDR8728543.1 Hca operon transcriptional activator HcaR [Burkholderia pseudomultivorans]MDR8737249.1 Hca operon transcriptional activator HcaR [Burkholderia pseudomultivorans]MDR8743242.1 Hca operon transcriptional activator HcaR [Burkholderia pseudomultivorans]MDR8754781.1 Hca operon transcriptional activator HcaR [Burkholderia pseudomultivorans]MDR8779916.1 Hca operon transcriptional activator HcaR [Burkholder
MDLRHLRYFLAVAEEGHFGRAAERLHIVQPALSVQIRALEDELGTALFVRSTRKVMLTDAGRLLVIEARRTLEQAERAKTLIQRAARGETGLVRIGFVGNAVATGRLSDDLIAFHAAWPGVALELHEMAPAAQQDAILAGRLDIGYCPAFGTAFDAKLSVRTVGSWSWQVVMSDRHPLAKRRTVPIAALMDEPFILYAADGDDEGQLAVLRQVLGRAPRVAHKVSSTLSVLALTGAGLGVALAPAPLSRIAAPNVVYRKLGKGGPRSELVALSRIGAEWGAVERYLAMLGERAA